jgi:glycosyltransferase involved in cell wall biosynthesis
MKPAIVIVAYNLPASLQRLFASISKADYPSLGRIDLVISIDKSDNNAVAEEAEKYI